MNLTPEQWARLTRPVRMEIERLERDLAHCRAILAAGPGDSDTFADPYETPRPLGRGMHIRFGGLGFDGTIDAQWDDGTLLVQVNNPGPAHGMAILPQSSNTIRIGFEGKS